MGDGLANGPAHCGGADAPGNIGADLSALAWGALNLAHDYSLAKEHGDIERKAISAEKARRLPLLTDAELAKLIVYAERNDVPSDRRMLIAERRRREPKPKPIVREVYAAGANVIRFHAARSALARPSREFDGEAPDGFGGSQRSVIDGASYAADMAHKAARGDWRKSPAVVADRARRDRPAGYPYSMSTDFCIALEAWGAECRARLANGPAFPRRQPNA